MLTSALNGKISQEKIVKLGKQDNTGYDNFLKSLKNWLFFLTKFAFLYKKNCMNSFLRFSCYLFRFLALVLWILSVCPVYPVKEKSFFFFVFALLLLIQIIDFFYGIASFSFFICFIQLFFLISLLFSI